MDTYSFLREVADSWGLLALFVFFIGAGVWAFWPSMRAARAEAAQIPFRNETLGVSVGCSGDCAGCRCGDLMEKEQANG